MEKQYSFKVLSNSDMILFKGDAVLQIQTIGKFT